MSARFLVGDVFDRMAELEGPYELVITSPPFSNLRSYLPDDHPDKAKEIGSEPTPAAFLDVMLTLTAEWGRLLAPHGSIAIELGDTYSGSGGGGGDYLPGGLRENQPGFGGSADRAREGNAAHWRQKNADKDGWPLAKSLAMIPELYAACLAYGRNLLTGQPSPAGRWRVRNFKPWIRSNPPVGALGDKERPATSYITVATRNVDRYFDLDAVRTTNPRVDEDPGGYRMVSGKPTHDAGPRSQNPADAPPLDWWHQVDALIDHVIDERAGAERRTATRAGTKLDYDGGHRSSLNSYEGTNPGARGVHIRRALETAGYLTTLDALDVSPKGYPGSHYAVWPMELVKLLLQEMCPRRVCVTCGKPSRRIVEVERQRQYGLDSHKGEDAPATTPGGPFSARGETIRETVGWSDCGCPEFVAPGSSRPQAVCSTGSEGSTPGATTKWRPARILDPFAGSGTTLAVATGHGIDADGIDIDSRNADLAQDRVGMFLEVIDHPTRTETVA